MQCKHRVRIAVLTLAITALSCGVPTIEPRDSDHFDAGALAVDSGAVDAGAVARDAEPVRDAGPSACDPLACDDGIACTDDACSGHACTHVVQHDPCGAGSYCDAVLGCVGGQACGTTEDCPPGPGGCFGPPVCIPDTRTCSYLVHDDDRDGYGAMSCGGLDCDDANATIHPGAPERCDGVDEDCDAALDSPLARGSCRDDQVCLDAACTCAPDRIECAGICRDTMTDVLACGACTTSCGPNEDCILGVCSCEPPYAACDAGCVQLDDDLEHCGACDVACVDGATCVGGECRCPIGQAACTFGCTTLGTVDDCAACGDACGAGASCTSAGCWPGFPWLAAYHGVGGRYPIPDSAHPLAIGPDGSVIHVGNYNDNVLYDSFSREWVLGRGEIVVSKHDEHGVRQWIRPWQAEGGSYSYGVIDAGVGDDGSIYALLHGTRDLVLDDGTVLTGRTTREILLVCLDAAGNYRWHRISNGAPWPYDLDVTGSEITLIGSSFGDIDFGGAPLPGIGGFVARLDGSTGTSLPSFRVPVTPQRLARNGETLFVAGSFEASFTVGSTTVTSVGGTDVFVAAFTTAGTPLGAFRLGLASDDHIVALVALSSGDLVLSATFVSLARVTPSGTIVWFRGGGIHHELAVDDADRIFSSTAVELGRAFRGYLADGTPLFDVPIDTVSLEVAARGSSVAIGGVWNGRSLDVGGFHVGPFYANRGLWVSRLSAP